MMLGFSIVFSGLLILATWVVWAWIDCPMWLFGVLTPASLLWAMYVVGWLIFFTV